MHLFLQVTPSTLCFNICCLPVFQEVVSGAQVLCCTLTGALHHHLHGVTFDVAVVDEAAQALEAATWSALLKAPRAVLAGEHRLAVGPLAKLFGQTAVWCCSWSSSLDGHMGLLSLMTPSASIPCALHHALHRVWAGPVCAGATIHCTYALCYAGDHLQLPPTVLSDAAAKHGLARTLFERLQVCHIQNAEHPRCQNCHLPLPAPLCSKSMYNIPRL